ncbi:MAG: methyl-accepting chemotaxis protein [Thermodesulfobacteriota bacterium]|nr:methyl-accepting chemotaxis protein [Thermodesulfobacteriota bacterium]
MISIIEKFLRKTGLRVKILLATITVVGVFTGAFLYQTLSFHSNSALRQVADSSQDLLENTYSAIKYPMSVGDSKTVEAQLQDIRDHMEGVEVYISDFQQRLTYASEEDRIHTNISHQLWEKETQQALVEAINTGMAPKESFTEFRGDKAFLVTIMPLLNEETCHHCHGASRRVLGTMVVKHPVRNVYDSLAQARNRLVGFSVVEIVGIILVINFLFNRLVTQRIHRLAEKSGQVSAGDVTVEVHDDNQDSIGLLARNFNQMIRDIRDRIEYANSLKLGISEPFFMVDRHMKLTYMNDAAGKLGGVRPDDVWGKMTCKEVYNADICHTVCAIKKAMETGEATVGLRATMKDAEGKEIPVMVSGAALKDSEGNVLGGFELIRDISKEVEAQSVLRESYLREEEAKTELQRRVKGLSQTLETVAGGDLTVRADISGKDDAMDHLVQKTNQTLDHMDELIGETKKAALTVVRGVRHISEGNLELSQRTQQQAATVEETSATVEELVSNISQNATNTQRADSLSKDAVAVAVEGGETVERTTQAMNDMAEGSRKIVEMMDLINEITFQTNLLSINAAVEAARAGEQGRGFAVVANEVRNLAKRSSEASKDIQGLVRDIMDQVNTGKEWVGELENGFKRIIQTIKQVSDALSEVSLATQESSRGIEQIGQGVEEMSDVTEHNATLVDELAGATEQLNEKAGLLQGMTEKFTLGDQTDPDAQDFSFAKSIAISRKDRRGTKPPTTRSLREELATQRPLQETTEEEIEDELEEGFEEF